MDIGDKVIFKHDVIKSCTIYTVVGTCGDRVQLEHPKFKYTTSWVDKDDLWVSESSRLAKKSS